MSPPDIVRIADVSPAAVGVYTIWNDCLEAACRVPSEGVTVNSGESIVALKSTSVSPVDLIVSVRIALSPTNVVPKSSEFSLMLQPAQEAIRVKLSPPLQAPEHAQIPKKSM